MYRFFILSMFFTMLFTINISANFRTEVVDTDKILGYLTDRSSVIDTNECMHIVYGNHGYLYYATNKSGAWQKEQIDTSRGGYASLALDKEGHLHISYQSNLGNRSALKYATNKDGTWVIDVVSTSIPFEGGKTSIAVDTLGNIYIAHTTEPCGLWCAGPSYYGLYLSTKSANSWQTQTLDSDMGAGKGLSMALDLNDNIYISYINDKYDDLYYISNKSGSWVKNLINSSINGYSTSIAIDSHNKIHISTHEYQSIPALNYLTNVSGSWQISTIDNSSGVGSDSSISLDKNGKIHISYRDFPNSNLKYIHNKDGNWSAVTLDDNGSARKGTSISIDRNGNVHISYYDQANSAVKYATNAPAYIAVPLFGLPAVLLLISLFGFTALRRIQRN